MRNPKPNWIGVNRSQHKVTGKKHNNVTGNKSKMKSKVKCPKTSNIGYHEDPFPDISLDVTPNDPFSNKCDCPEEAYI